METILGKCYKYCVYNENGVWYECDVYSLLDEWLGTIRLFKDEKYDVVYACGCNWLPLKSALRALGCEMYLKEEIQ
jgi:hypothetical protein